MHRHWYSTDTPSITTNTDTMEVMFSCIFSCSIPTLCTSPPRSWRHWSILWTTQQLTWRTWGPRVPSSAERSRTSSRSEALVWSRYNIIEEWEKLMAGMRGRVLLQLCSLAMFHLKPPKYWIIVPLSPDLSDCMVIKIALLPMHGCGIRSTN